MDDKKKASEDDEAPEGTPAPEGSEDEPQFEQHGKAQKGVQPQEEDDIPEAGQ